MPISGLRACSLCYCKFDTQLGAAVPPICAPFTIAERVNFMHGYCERLKRHPEAHPGDRSDYKRMVAWAAKMQTHIITYSTNAYCHADFTTTPGVACRPRPGPPCAEAYPDESS